MFKSTTYQFVLGIAWYSMLHGATTIGYRMFKETPLQRTQTQVAKYPQTGHQTLT